MPHAKFLARALGGRPTAGNPRLVILGASALLFATGSGSSTTASAASVTEREHQAVTNAGQHGMAGAAERLQRHHRRLRGLLPVGGFGGSANEWLRDISAAPVAAHSGALVANLTQQVASRYNGVAAFNYDAYNVAFFTAHPSTPETTVIWDNCQNKAQVPAALYDRAAGAHFVGVPIPAKAVPSKGSDGELTIWRPATHQLWELWRARKRADGWHACWGGRIDHFWSNRGHFRQPMGVSASGMELASGVVGIKEMQAGHIDHALAIGLPEVANYSTWSYPANRSDGQLPTGTRHAIMEGQRFRLDPSIHVASLRLTPIAAAVARAAKRYGFIVTDVAGTLTISTESGANAAHQTGTNPWLAMMGGLPSWEIMRNFPWDRLQALPVDYGKAR
jgi:hypothetical protein